MGSTNNSNNFDYGYIGKPSSYLYQERANKVTVLTHAQIDLQVNLSATPCTVRELIIVDMGLSCLYLLSITLKVFC